MLVNHYQNKLFKFLTTDTTAQSLLTTFKVVEEARAEVAKAINASSDEIYFTSGGSESDNQAIMSVARMGEIKNKKHIVTSKIEHHAVLHTLKKLEKSGFEVTYLDDTFWPMKFMC